MEHEYTAKLGDRKVLDTGSVRYPLKIVCEDHDKVIVDTTYTVSKRQEERIEDMVEQFAKKKAEEYEQDKGVDQSGKTISV